MKSFSVFLPLMIAAAAIGAEPSPPAESHQVLYLADSGLVTLDFSVLIEGEGPRLHFEKYVDSLLKELDKNGDGIVSVEESRGKLITAREVVQLQLVVSDGNPADSSPDVSPKDGKISRSELIAYFKRIGLSPFSVKLVPRTAAADPNTGNPVNSQGDTPLFDRIDVNGDKKLSVEELANALEVLRKLDRDNDETISAAELQPLAAQPMPVNRPGMNNTPPAAMPFVSLASGESVQKMIRRVVDKYDSADASKSGVPSLSTKNQKLSRMELGITEAEFVKYDVDGDGQLDFTELRQFVSSPVAGLKLTADLATGKTAAAGHQETIIRTTADGAINLQFGAAQISLSALPAPARIDPEVTIKPLFMAFDGDANGYLEKNEVSESVLFGATFAALDADKNGKLYLEELAEYLKTRIDVARNRVELTIIEQGRTLFEILDSDRDGRLAHREMRSVADKLALWDADGDGMLAENEIPLQYRMVAAQGAIPNLGIFAQDPSAMANAGRVARQDSGPIWFRKMDRNSDGEVSRREFLGDLTLFDKLDLNHDGALELNEAILARPAK